MGDVHNLNIQVQDMKEDPLTMLNFYHVIEIYETKGCTFSVNEETGLDGGTIIDKIGTFVDKMNDDQKLTLKLLKCGKTNEEKTINLNKDQAEKLNEKLQKYKNEKEKSDSKAKELTEKLDELQVRFDNLNEELLKEH